MKFITGHNLVLISALLITPISHADITDVSCVYETTEQDIKETRGHSHNHHEKNATQWFFWRTDKTVEVSNAEKSFGEKWILGDKNTVFYQALYHDKQFAMDFQPTDLKILGKQTNWAMRSSLLPQSLLKQLKQIENGKFNQYHTVRYQGKVAGVEYQVDWIPQLKLPARIKKTGMKKTVLTELKEIYPLNKTPHKAQLSELYDDMDYADIGDNESHPVVAQLQKSTGIGYFHQH